MATNNAFKVTKDTSARKGTRVGSIQSNVEAAAMRESHEYFVTRLTQGYNKQLETMEQEYEEQLRELKARLATDVEKAKQDAIKDHKAQAAPQADAAEAKLVQMQKKLDTYMEAYNIETTLVSSAERKYITLGNRHQAQIDQMNKAHEAALDKAHREKNTGPHRWIEIIFIKRLVNGGRLKPKSVVKKGSMKLIELVQVANNCKTADAWDFEHQGRALKDMDKTLLQVGSIMV